MAGFSAGAYIVGDIVARMTLDRDPFQRGLKEAAAEEKAFPKEVKVEVKADTKEALTGLAALRADLDRLDHEIATIKVEEVTTAAGRRELERLRAVAAEVREDFEGGTFALGTLNEAGLRGILASLAAAHRSAAELGATVQEAVKIDPAKLGDAIAEGLDRGLGTGRSWNLGEQIAEGLDRGLGTGRSWDLGRQIIEAASMSNASAGDALAAVAAGAAGGGSSIPPDLLAMAAAAAGGGAGGGGGGGKAGGGAGGGGGGGKAGGGAGGGGGGGKGPADAGGFWDAYGGGGLFSQHLLGHPHMWQRLGATGWALSALQVSSATLPVTLSLISAAAAATAGLAALGMAARPTLSAIASGYQAVDKAATAVDNAVPGTQAWASAVGNLGAAWGNIPIAIQPAVSAIENMAQLPIAGQVQSWVVHWVQTFAGRAGSGIFDPLITNTMSALSKVFNSILSGHSLQHFVDTLAKMVGPAINDFYQLAKAIGHVFSAFASMALGGQGFALLIQAVRTLGDLLHNPVIQGFVQGMVAADRVILSIFDAVLKVVGAVAQLGGGTKVIKTLTEDMILFSAATWAANRALGAFGIGGPSTRTLKRAAAGGDQAAADVLAGAGGKSLVERLLGTRLAGALGLSEIGAADLLPIVAGGFGIYELAKHRKAIHSAFTTHVGSPVDTYLGNQARNGGPMTSLLAGAQKAAFDFFTGNFGALFRQPGAGLPTDNSRAGMHYFVPHGGGPSVPMPLITTQANAFLTATKDVKTGVSLARSSVISFLGALDSNTKAMGQAIPSMQNLAKAAQGAGQGIMHAATFFKPFTVAAPAVTASATSMGQAVNQVVANLQHQNLTLAGWAVDAQTLLKRGMSPGAVESLAKQTPALLGTMVHASKGQLKAFNVAFDESMLETQMEGKNSVLGINAVIALALHSNSAAMRQAARNYQSAISGGQSAAMQLAQAQQYVTQALTNLNGAISAVSASWNRFIGVNLSAKNAAAAFTLSLNSLATALKTNHADLNVNTVAGARNTQAVDASVAAIGSQISAMAKQHDSVQSIDAVYAQHRASLVKVMVQYGFTKAAANAYITQLGLTPKHLNTVLKLNGYGTAMSQLSNAQARADKLKNTKIDLYAWVHLQGFSTAMAQISQLRAAMGAAPVAFQTVRSHYSGFASGTTSAPGGLAWVGERGPELVNLPRGTQVIPAGLSAAIASAPGFASGTDLPLGWGYSPLWRAVVGLPDAFAAAVAPNFVALSNDILGALAKVTSAVTAGTSAVVKALQSLGQSLSSVASLGAGVPAAAAGAGALAPGFHLIGKPIPAPKHPKSAPMSMYHWVSPTMGSVNFFGTLAQAIAQGYHPASAAGAAAAALNPGLHLLGAPIKAPSHMGLYTWMANGRQMNFFGTLAQAQAQGYLGKALSFDKGGSLPPGLSLVHNGLGRPEPVGEPSDIHLTIPITAAIDGEEFSGLLDTHIRRGVDEGLARVVHLKRMGPRPGVR